VRCDALQARSLHRPFSGSHQTGLGAWRDSEFVRRATTSGSVNSLSGRPATRKNKQKTFSISDINVILSSEVMYPRKRSPSLAPATIEVTT